MLLTRTDTGDTIMLPDDLHWTDKAWSPVVQTAEWSLTGALILDEATKQAGRPITLESYSGVGGQGGAITQTVANALIAWSHVSGLTMILNRLGVDYSVTWRHESGAALSLEPVLFLVNTSGNPDDDPWYSIILRFWEL